MWIFGLSTILVKETKIQVLKSKHSENYNNISILRTLHFNKQCSSEDGFEISFGAKSHESSWSHEYKFPCLVLSTIYFVFRQYVAFNCCHLFTTRNPLSQ